MGRSIIAVIAGYVSMFILNFIGFVTLFVILGPANAFKPRLYIASNRWIAIALVMTFITAIIGGLICAAIAKGGKAPVALAVVIIVLGWTMGIFEIRKHDANAGLVRPAEVPIAEAAQKAYWPNWVPFAFPIGGAIGVLIGSKLKRKK